MHLPTVVIITLLMNIITSFYLALLYRQKPKYRCFKYWSYSCASFVLGGILGALRAYDFPEFMTFFISECLLLSAPLFVLAGLIQFSRFRYTRRRRKQAMVGVGVIFISFLITYQQPATMSLIATAAMAIAFVFCALLLQKSVFTEPVFTRTLQVIFILHGITMLVQVGLIVTQWQNTYFGGLPESSIYTLLSHMLLTTITSLLMPWLCFLQLERKLILRTQRDGLTKLANREHFFNLIERYWRQYPTTSSAIMMIDIDHFKKVNDNFGHAVGDRAIKSVANILSKQLRSKDLIGRIGGEEYAALLTDVNPQTAHHIGLRLCQRVEQQLSCLDDIDLKLTISIGVVAFVPEQLNHTLAFEAADEALYKSKETGRNKITLGNTR